MTMYGPEAAGEGSEQPIDTSIFRPEIPETTIEGIVLPGTYIPGSGLNDGPIPGSVDPTIAFSRISPENNGESRKDALLSQNSLPGKRLIVAAGVLALGALIVAAGSQIPRWLGLDAGSDAFVMGDRLPARSHTVSPLPKTPPSVSVEASPEEEEPTEEPTEEWVDEPTEEATATESPTVMPSEIMSSDPSEETSTPILPTLTPAPTFTPTPTVVLPIPTPTPTPTPSQIPSETTPTPVAPTVIISADKEDSQRESRRWWPWRHNDERKSRGATIDSFTQELTKRLQANGINVVVADEQVAQNGLAIEVSGDQNEVWYNARHHEFLPDSPEAKKDAIDACVAGRIASVTQVNWQALSGETVTGPTKYVPFFNRQVPDGPSIELKVDFGNDAPRKQQERLAAAAATIGSALTTSFGEWQPAIDECTKTYQG